MFLCWEPSLEYRTQNCLPGVLPSRPYSGGRGTYLGLVVSAEIHTCKQVPSPATQLEHVTCFSCSLQELQKQHKRGADVTASLPPSGYPWTHLLSEARPLPTSEWRL